MKLAVIIALSLLSVSVQAQDVRMLTVDEAIARARERSPERIRTEAFERQAQMVRQNASRLFNERPELEVEYVTERPFGEPDFELSIGLTQEIPIWGARSRQQDLAGALESSSIASRSFLDKVIAFRTRLLYNRAWSLSQQIELGNRLIVTSNRLADATDKRLNAGDVSRLERNTVVLETNSIRIEHEQVHSEYEQAIGELEALTGLSLQNVELQRDRTPSVSDSLEGNTYRLSPEWSRLNNDVEIARAHLELARSEVNENPTVGIHYSEDLLTIAEDDISYRESAPQNITGIYAPGRSAGVSISMQLPITIPGIWGPDNMEVIEREAELRSLEADLQQLEIELTGRLARIRPKLARLNRAMSIYQESVDLIRENHDLLDRGYEGGELSVTELLVGRQQLIELQTRQLQLLREMREAEIELQSITGR